MDLDNSSNLIGVTYKYTYIHTNIQTYTQTSMTEWTSHSPTPLANSYFSEKNNSKTIAETKKVAITWKLRGAQQFFGISRRGVDYHYYPKMENPKGWGSYMKFPQWRGYGYFLELHNAKLIFASLSSPDSSGMNMWAVEVLCEDMFYQVVFFTFFLHFHGFESVHVLKFTGSRITFAIECSQ